MIANNLVVLTAIALANPTLSGLNTTEYTTNNYSVCEYMTVYRGANIYNVPHTIYPCSDNFGTNVCTVDLSGINSKVFEYTSKEVCTMTEEQQENIDVLNSFMSLDDNWDDCNALAPKKELITFVKSLIMQLTVQPEIFPTPDGGIQLEYAVGRNKHLNIEICNEQTARIFEMYADRTYKTETVVFDYKYLNRRIYEFYSS